MMSTFIFSRSILRYRLQSEYALPVIYAWQTQRRYPIITLAVVSLLVRFVAFEVGLEYARLLTFFLTGALSTLLGFIAHTDMQWLVHCEALRTKNILVKEHLF
eukprot:Gregarina_sp_Poly_1__4556@NODE_2443_length_2129_cov_78_994665_g1551_i0_p3_GENE_NODE_2443_length_2129_cov_78_994665_g1551_i0NODE_2443_length_2129_cov_78_994665_g1551_i0_p3_ORF_typecomplete_len103_score3_23_NODE_2443_length_2129_cov_78_994665_g1551_i0162470